MAGNAAFVRVPWKNELRPPPRDIVTSQGGGLNFYLFEKGNKPF
jgi:hypothetical protein